jgi:hypothetical protein
VEGNNVIEVDNRFVGDAMTTNGTYRIYGFRDYEGGNVTNTPNMAVREVSTPLITMGSIGGTGVLSQKALKKSMVDDEIITVSFVSGDIGLLCVTISDGAVSETAIFSLCFIDSTDTVSVAKISGSANTSIIEEDGKLCVYPGAAASDSYKIKNTLGVGVTIMAVMFN